MKINQRGQSTVEYILLVTAVIAVLIVFLVKDNSVFKGKVTNTYSNVAQQAVDKAGVLESSHDTDPGDGSGTIVPSTMQIDVQSNFPTSQPNE